MEILKKGYKEYKLDNGLVVALQKTPTKTINSQLSVYFGTVHENKGEEGLAHFLEHCLFMGGTEKYSPEESDRIRESFGPKCVQGITTLEETFFSSDILSEDLEKYLDWLSSILFSPRLDKDRVEEERQIVLRETSDRKAGKDYIDEKKFRKLIYPVNHPFNLETMGDKNVIISANRDDLKELHSRGYNANNMELILVGGLSYNTERLIEKYFQDKSSGKNMRFEFPLIDSIDKKVILHTSAPDMYNRENPNESNSYVLLDIFVPPRTHKDFFALDMLSKVLEEGQTSRLFKKLRQEKGLAYNISSSYDGTCNAGIIRVEGNIISKRQNEAIDLIFDEFRKLRESPVESYELNRKKHDKKYGFAKMLENNLEILSIIRGKLEHGITPDIYILKTDALTAEKIQEAAIKYLPKNREEGKYALLIRDPLKNK